MDRFSTDQIDRELGRWLREESATRAPAGLVEEVFARTSRTGQARRWWPPISLRRSRAAGPHALERGRAPAWRPGSALGSVVVIVVVVVGLALALRPSWPGPGTFVTPSPSPAPSPSLTASPVARGASASTAPTPVPTALGTLSARRLDLGSDAAPISVTEAFGSIWVADIHANDVRRFEPTSMRELARIPVPGAAWFVVADNALWVTSQTGTGVSRIDPATNTVVAHVGDVPPCGAPVVAFGSLWQAACDADVILKIDPTRNAVLESIPAQGHLFLVLAGGRLITVGQEGLASLDPTTGRFTTIGGKAAVGVEFMASDGATVWVKNSAGIARIDPTDGRTIAGISAPQAQAISFAAGHGWLTVTGQGVLEVDLATNQTTRTVPVLPAPLIPLEASGVLWVTDFSSSVLWRIDL
jgi:DNA-binding beta-propeller fold protein YncE